jgi:LysR family transcriptional regulator, hydrogen peroxide-inducible genes activator
MEMHQISYFLALCEEGNFTRAAQRCDVAQPSLTKAIKCLESELGGALFYRGKYESRLTKLGKMVKPRLQKIRLEAGRTHEVAQKFNAQSSIGP